MTALTDQAGAVRAGEELDLSRLEPFLREYFGDQGPISIEQFPSGHSNLTYLVRIGDKEAVLRRPPFGSNVRTAHDMSREYRVLSKLHSIYPLAPRARIYCGDLSILGAPFYLMDPIHGIILRHDPPRGIVLSPDTARRLSEAFIDKLAHLHSLDFAAAGLGDLGKPQGYLERQVKGWIERYHNSKTHHIPEIEQISSWLISHLPASPNAALIHNDYKYDNLVLDANNVINIIGVLDWEMCTVGDPLTDLGTTLAYWVEPEDSREFQETCSAPTNLPGTLNRKDLIARYAAATGRDPSHMVFYLAFGRFKVAVIIQQIYYRFEKGLTRDARFACLPKRIHALLRASWQGAESGTI